VVLAEDDDTYAPLPLASLRVPSPGPAPRRSPHARKPERVLFIGWRRDMDALVKVGSMCILPYELPQ